MQTPDIHEITRLLTELRDTQREHLAEYRKAASESIELQRQAVLRQQQAVRFSSRAVVLIGIIIFGTVFLLVYLRAEACLVN